MLVVRRHFSTLNSTIQWAKEHIDEWEKDRITLVTADHQTAGVGQHNRKWISPPGQNIAASFCFFLKEPRKDLINLPQILQLTTANLLEKMSFKPVIKWPNDLLIAGKKLAGVLCSTFEHDGKVCVILSIGLNVNTENETLDLIDQPATSLLVEGGKKIDLDSLMEAISTSFESDFNLFLEKGFSPFIDAFRKRLQLKKGDQITLSGKKGTFESINDDGSLNLKLQSGEIQRIY